MSRTNTLISNIYELAFEQKTIFQYGFDVVGETQVRNTFFRLVCNQLMEQKFPNVEKDFWTVEGSTLITVVELPLLKLGESIDISIPSRSGEPTARTITITSQTAAKNTDRTELVSSFLNRALHRAMANAPYTFAKDRYLLERLNDSPEFRGDRHAQATFRNADVFRGIRPTIAINKTPVLTYDVCHRVVMRVRADKHDWRQGDFGQLRVVPIYDERSSFVALDMVQKNWNSPMGDNEKTFKSYYTEKFSRPARREADQAGWAEAKAIVSRTNGVVPMIRTVGRHGDEIFLLPALCRMVDLDTDTRQGIPKITGIKPTPRAKAQLELKAVLSKKTRTATRTPLAVLKIWGMTPADKPLEVSGENLPQPKISVAGIRQECMPFKIAPNLAKARMQPGFRVSTWVWLVQDRAQRTLETHQEHLVNSAERWGLRYERQQTVNISGNNANAFFDQIKKLGSPGSLSKMAFLIYINKADHIYRDVKAFLARNNITSQFVDASRHFKTRPSDIASSLVMQTLCKLNPTASPWEIKRLSPPSMPLPVLSVGIDVYHGAITFMRDGKTRQNRSVIGMSAWYLGTDSTTVHFGQPVETVARKEVMDRSQDVFSIDGHLQMFLEDVLGRINAQRKAAPKTVVVLRDGVADTQKGAVQAREVPQVHAALNAKNAEGAKVVFAFVQKRIAQQFIAQGGRDGYDHAPAGTIIRDPKVVADPETEFFLFSMGRAPSTNKAVHYYVVDNKARIPVKDIAAFAFNASHLYYNWAGPVKVPAMTQTAHSMAFTVGEKMKEMTESERKRNYPVHMGLVFI
ncbi:Piwi domain [Carpediemonas membranifera]|uniref:Piwi domain n=1 Tax=Carpediemonas membranifera TaxID=201153 RepID=A0A8J6B4S4_9EUKA|nr:Piwi domain [Carpediemonas membranifera]|eukprot:KAG9390027.1 Piwi domain [Carpediemonas membranifera]